MPALFRRALGALALLSSLVALPAAAIDESDLLPVDQAYVLSAEAAGADAVRIRWKIADGYYLYRHRISVEPTGAGVLAGALRMPKGEPHEDSFFGKTETYRRELVATLPDIAGHGRALSLKIKYQGCADVGICYPPQTHTLSVTMPVAATDGGAGSDPLARDGIPGVIGGGNRLGDLLGDAGGLDKAPLPEEQAFRFEAIAGDGNTLLLRFTPARGYYLYRDRSRFVLEADGIAAAAPRWPKGVVHHDEHFGDVVVYFDAVDVELPLRRRTPDAQTATLRATFQGCQKDGICYPPMTRSVKIELPRGEVRDASAPATADGATGKTVGEAIAELGGESSQATASSPTPPSTDATTSAEAPAATQDAAQDGIAAPGESRSADTLLAALALALLGGLILNLMPCVLPVLSLKALGLAGSGESPARARAHALWYTAGVLSSFVALGALAMALRQAGQALGWGFQLQQPLVVAGLGLLMFVFGLSLSGVWHVGGRWVGVGHGLASRGGAIGDFFTGMLAVVVAAPCTAPFMAPALGWAFAAPTGAALLVFACLGLGLALPFLLIGFVPGLARRLPKPGAWMDTFKQILAFPMYLTAIWLVWVLAKQRGADAVGWWALAALALAFAAWAWTHARAHDARWGRIAAIVALLATAWPLYAIATMPRDDAARVQSTGVANAVSFSEQRLADLRRSGRVVLVNMTADWCVTCKANEKAVFAREDFRRALEDTNAVYMVGDWTDVDPAITAYLQRYKAVGVPLYVVYPGDGGEGTVLPTVLTPQIVRRALEGAAKR
ncbi:MAG: protein-disulfide reductase DsbD domain-containing protein [Pseudomonadota bacterium]